VDHASQGNAIRLVDVEKDADMFARLQHNLARFGPFVTNL
jgi:hypothetical protein